MKSKILLPLCLALFLGCSSHDVKPNTTTQNSFSTNTKSKLPSRITLINLGDQNANLLPNAAPNVQLDGAHLLAKRFATFSAKVSQKERKDAFWGLEAYKYRPNKPYYGSNFRPVTKEWFDAVHQNTNQEAFLSISALALTTANTTQRNLPSDDPLFYNPQNAGEGYPFDYLQNSALSIGFPLFVSHLSRDGAWAMVRDDDVWGWVKVEDIRFINKAEAQTYQNSRFLAITTDKTPVYNERGWFLFFARVGSLLPYESEDTQSFYGKIYTRSGLSNFIIPKRHSAHFPLSFTQKNLSQMTQSLLGEAYGWGGIDKLRDCSLMTKDVLGSFGVWLPRNSKAQANVGTKINLEGLSNSEKIAVIKERAVPYATLLYLPGHIMLYVGIKDNKPLVLHDAWGIKTQGDGRALIGGIAITTLDVGADVAGVETDSLLISKIRSMNIVGGLGAAPLPSQKISQVKNFSPKDTAFSKAEQEINFASQAKTMPNLTDFSQPATQINIAVSSIDEPCLHPDANATYAALAPLDAPLSDAGRCRDYELLGKLYGKNQSEVSANLTDVIWLKDFGAKKLKFNHQNGAAKALQAVSDELNELAKHDANLLKFLKDSGTFKWRLIAGTNRLSAHSYAIAIDINVEQSGYWRWSKEYKNTLPQAIVHAFERHNFIWGGRWKHFDSMHFEYRPEILKESK